MNGVRCPECGTVRILTGSGPRARIRQHMAKTGGKPAVCAGSGKAPPVGALLIPVGKGR